MALCLELQHDCQVLLSRIQTALMASYVEGTLPVSSNLHYWNRSQYDTFVSNEDWQRLELEKQRPELGGFFDIRPAPGGYNLKFQRQPEFVNQRWKRGWGDPLESIRILTVLNKEILPIKDPVQRAAKILYLLPRLHPFENGNGRLARLWAALELKKAGFAIHLGLPTNDFFMTEKRLRLEVRKAARLGGFWESMIRKAQAEGVKPDDFFQKVYRGSALEGLVHINPVNDAEFASYLHWLEAQPAPPEWGKEYSRVVEAKVRELAEAYGGLEKSSELSRVVALDTLWQNFQNERGPWVPGARPSLAPRVGLSKVSGIYFRCLEKIKQSLRGPLAH